MRNGATPLGTLVYSPVGPGAGGWVTGITIANDGVKMIRNDTFNAYVRSSSATEWTLQLVPPTNIAESAIDLFYGGDPQPWGTVGTYDVAIAPSNSAVRYMVCMGKVFVTQNAGVTYAVSALPQKLNCHPNQTARMSGKPLVVDPQNPGHVLFFAPSDGAYRSTDYGATWTAISTASLPLPTSGTRACFAFDPSSAVVGVAPNNIKQGIYCFINGTGVRRSVDGGVTWTTPAQPLVNPTIGSHLKIAANGKVFLAGGSAEVEVGLRIFDGATWTTSTKICKSVAISPFTAGLIYACGASGYLDVSRDYGATWDLDGSNGKFVSRVQGDGIGWQVYTDGSYLSVGDMEFDPLVNRIWLTGGTGVWSTDSPLSTFTFGGPSIIWTERSAKIENMVSMALNMNPRGDLGYGCHDRGLFVLPKAGLGRVYPATHGVDNGFQHGNTLDWAPEDYSFWAGTSFLGGRASGYTTDNGATWSRVDGIITASGTGVGGGMLAVLTKDIWLQTQGNQGSPLASNRAKNGVWRTANRGVTWTQCTLGNNDLFMHQSAIQWRRSLVADKLTPGRAYAHNTGDGTGDASDLAQRGIWETTDYGVTWTRIYAGYIYSYGADYYNLFLTQVSSTEWLACAGNGSNGLMRSTDSMRTWTEVTGTDDQLAASSFQEVFGVGVGKAKFGSAFKTLLVIGWRRDGAVLPADSTGYGAWMSTDNGVTWQLKGKFPGGVFDCCTSIAGDPTRYGLFTIGWQGYGISKLDYSYNLRAS